MLMCISLIWPDRNLGTCAPSAGYRNSKEVRYTYGCKDEKIDLMRYCIALRAHYQFAIFSLLTFFGDSLTIFHSKNNRVRSVFAVKIVPDDLCRLGSMLKLGLLKAQVRWHNSKAGNPCHQSCSDSNREERAVDWGSFHGCMSPG